MSAMPLKATELLRRREKTRRANKRHCWAVDSTWHSDQLVVPISLAEVT